ncbi:MAG: transposase [Candidatus Heimdallarchaeota archaeon]
MKYAILPSILTYLRAAVTPGSPSLRKPGRPPFDRRSMLCAFVCKALLGLPSENALHRELARNPSLCELCGFLTVPSVRTLNRFRARRHRLIEAVFQKLADRFAEIYGLGTHLAVDSTPIPVKKTDQDARKGYGTRGWFYGYKLHILASCETKLPVRAVLTRGNRHDAPLLPRLLKAQPHTPGRYLLADAGYDSEENIATIWESGAAPLVQLNRRRGLTTTKLGIRGRQGFPVGDPDWKRHMRWRSQVEGIFGRLKREFLRWGVPVKGFRNVKFHLLTYLCAMVAHALACIKLSCERVMLRIWEVFQ